MTGQQLLDQPAVDVDEAALERLDEAWAIGCEYEETPEAACGKPAAWWIRCRACTHAFTECATHRIEEAAAMRTWTSVYCTTCHRRVPAASWRDLFDIVPIGGHP